MEQAETLRNPLATEASLNAAIERTRERFFKARQIHHRLRDCAEATQSGRFIPNERAASFIENCLWDDLMRLYDIQAARAEAKWLRLLKEHEAEAAGTLPQSHRSEDMEQVETLRNQLATLPALYAATRKPKERARLAVRAGGRPSRQPCCGRND